MSRTQHIKYMLSLTWLVIYCIYTAVSDCMLYSVSFSSTQRIGLLYLLAAAAGQYLDYHMHRLHALMSKNPHLDDLHLLLCQLEFLQQRHYRSEHTRRKKNRLEMVFHRAYNWIYYILFFFSIWHLNLADDTQLNCCVCRGQQLMNL